ncbi:peptide methionine sulfoxide reductase [Alkalibacterium sp. f15]|uniref:peptide methionine sulfoxide reductase n=1 Tax=Alkalibacterium sp. f15 TaxID=3414029 RepID=UPI003BF7AEB5
MEKTADFILWLSKEEQEEKMENLWMHSESGLSYKKWKEKNYKDSSSASQKRKKIDKNKEQKALENASLVLGKAIGKGGGND